MRVTRHAFLQSTTAYTSANLYHSQASAPITARSLSKPRWHAVWFQPMDKQPVDLTGFDGLGMTRYTLDHALMAKLKAARPGQGLREMQTTTTHFIPDAPAEFFG